MFKLSQATTLATRSKWRLLGPFLGLLALLAALWGSWKLGVDHGIGKGIDAYHELCATVGGFVVDNETGVVVQCKGVGVVPQQELQKNFRSDA